MKKILLFYFCLWSSMLVNAQSLTYEFEYDHAGNRIRRTVIQLNNRDELGESIEESSSVLSDRLSNGEIMRLYPNPTTDNIQFELDGDGQIGGYVLSDITGKTIKTGTCNNSSLTLDLTGIQFTLRDPNFRNNLISASGFDPGSAAQAHHVFPMKYAQFFESAGINPNSYGAWWGEGHLQNAYQ